MVGSLVNSVTRQSWGHPLRKPLVDSFLQVSVRIVRFCVSVAFPLPQTPPLPGLWTVVSAGRSQN